MEASVSMIKSHMISPKGHSPDASRLPKKAQTLDFGKWVKVSMGSAWLCMALRFFCGFPNLQLVKVCQGQSSMWVSGHVGTKTAAAAPTMRQVYHPNRHCGTASVTCPSKMEAYTVEFGDFFQFMWNRRFRFE